MQNVVLDQGMRQGEGEMSNSRLDLKSKVRGDDGRELETEESVSREDRSSVRGDGFATITDEAVVGIVISVPEEVAALKARPPKSIGVGLAVSQDDKLPDASPKKKSFPRSESYSDECRVCQQSSDEPLIDLGCRCRGELAKAHLSCIKIWFHTRGSNKCEICQEIAANVPLPETQPSANYWIWRIEPAFGGSNMVQAERERGCFSPLWIAFCILIGGLLLDVLISISLGVSALPANIIIGVLIMLGLGTALRLSLECCHDWSLRRNAPVPANTVANPPPTPLEV